jgi:hypothetical protein
MQEGNNGGNVFRRIDPPSDLATMVSALKQNQPQYPSQNQYSQQNYPQQFPQNSQQFPQNPTQYPPASYYDQNTVTPPVPSYNPNQSQQNNYPQSPQQFPQNQPQISVQKQEISPQRGDLRNSVLSDLENMTVEEVERFNKQVEQIALTKKYSTYIESFLEVLKTIDKDPDAHICVISKNRAGFDFRLSKFHAFDKTQNCFMYNNKTDAGSVIIAEPLPEYKPEPQIEITKESVQSMKTFLNTTITDVIAIQEPGLMVSEEE